MANIQLLGSIDLVGFQIDLAAEFVANSVGFHSVGWTEQLPQSHSASSPSLLRKICSLCIKDLVVP